MSSKDTPFLRGDLVNTLLICGTILIVGAWVVNTLSPHNPYVFRPSGLHGWVFLNAAGILELARALMGLAKRRPADPPQASGTDE